MKTTINVTQEDIDAGHPCSAGSCPIARAVNRMLKERHECTVSSDITFYETSRGLTYRAYAKTPRRAITFIKRFDSDLSVKPFSFELDIPQDLLKQKS